MNIFCQGFVICKNVCLQQKLHAFFNEYLTELLFSYTMYVKLYNYKIFFEQFFNVPFEKLKCIHEGVKKLITRTYPNIEGTLLHSRANLSIVLMTWSHSFLIDSVLSCPHRIFRNKLLLLQRQTCFLAVLSPSILCLTFTTTLLHSEGFNHILRMFSLDFVFLFVLCCFKSDYFHLCRSPPPHVHHTENVWFIKPGVESSNDF